ncbi:uncharacterized protein [Rutidosis leptorrhynchoides]|uniref:uncharacterized protein n=1 Tax=Rutidosis leptorrhynchoides TaxID=125765 RepID=UPI003A9945B9
MVCERFQRSPETISRHFNEALLCVTSMANDIIKPLDPTFSNIPPHILYNERDIPFFKDCIGAIDRTHIQACVSANEQVPFIGRKGIATQNVMIACDFNMCFTFVSTGWEGSAHDTRVFYNAIRRPEMNFPHLSNGKYYLIDAGYLNIKGYLGPYRGNKYHISDFRRANGPLGLKEKFNKIYSSKHNMIERTFGVWKKK